MRPDKSDMIMLAANFFWNGLPVDVVVAAGNRPKRKALDWQFGTEASVDLSGGGGLVCLRSTSISGRDLRPYRAR
jgi:hypothetical protein